MKSFSILARKAWEERDLLHDTVQGDRNENLHMQEQTKTCIEQLFDGQCFSWNTFE